MAWSDQFVCNVSDDFTKGYWSIYADGGVFTHGKLPFHGSVPGEHVNLLHPIASAYATPGNGGYLMTDIAGNNYGFGNAKNYGNGKNPT